MAAYNTEGLIDGRLKIGNTLYELTEIRYGANGALVWPTAYIATLTPTWSYGGQYTLAAIPASGGTATKTITQDHINHEVSYETQSGTVKAYIKNTDNSNSHSFTYNVIYDGTEIVPETTSTWSAGEKRQVGGGQTGHILTAQVSKEDGVSRVTS